MLIVSGFPHWFKCSMLHPGHLCLLSNNRGGFWEVCRRPGVKGMSNVMEFPPGVEESMWEDVAGRRGREGWAVGRASLFMPIRWYYVYLLSTLVARCFPCLVSTAQWIREILPSPCFSSCSYLSSLETFLTPRWAYFPLPLCSSGPSCRHPSGVC